MRLRIKRTYFRDDCTLGFLQVEREGGRWEYLCDTVEPRAIAWVDRPLIGQKAGVHVPGRTAIPEGRYRIEIRESKTYKREMPFLCGVPGFRKVVLRTGRSPARSRGDILVGDRRTFGRLFGMIREAVSDGEPVSVEVRSPRGWGAPPTCSMSAPGGWCVCRRPRCRS